MLSGSLLPKIGLRPDVITQSEEKFKKHLDTVKMVRYNLNDVKIEVDL